MSRCKFKQEGRNIPRAHFQIEDFAVIAPKVILYIVIVAMNIQITFFVVVAAGVIVMVIVNGY